MNELACMKLETFTIADAAELFVLVDRNRASLQKFWWESKTRFPADSEQFISAAIHDEQYTGRPTRAIRLGSGALIGVGSVHSIDWEQKRGAIGYWIDQDHGGNGYATTTARLLSQIAFSTLGLRVVTIGCREDNMASRSVAEKAGFTLVSIDHQPTWQEGVKSTRTAHYELVNQNFSSGSRASWN